MKQKRIKTYRQLVKVLKETIRLIDAEVSEGEIWRAFNKAMDSFNFDEETK